MCWRAYWRTSYGRGYIAGNAIAAAIGLAGSLSCREGLCLFMRARQAHVAHARLAQNGLSIPDCQQPSCRNHRCRRQGWEVAQSFMVCSEFSVFGLILRLVR